MGLTEFLGKTMTGLALITAGCLACLADIYIYMCTQSAHTGQYPQNPFEFKLITSRQGFLTRKVEITIC
jgi:hypothetical protein